MDFGTVVAASDSPYAIIAIALIGLYALGWRWGGKILDRMDKNAETAVAAKKLAVEVRDTANTIVESIKTNHGSRNLGDAIDRLQEWMLQHMQDSQHGMEQLRTLQGIVIASAVDTEHVREQIAERFSGLDDLLAQMQARVDAIEKSKNGDDQPALFT